MLFFRNILWEVASGRHNKNQIPPQFITFLFCKTTQMELKVVKKKIDEYNKKKDTKHTKNLY